MIYMIAIILWLLSIGGAGYEGYRIAQKICEGEKAVERAARLEDQNKKANESSNDTAETNISFDNEEVAARKRALEILERLNTVPPKDVVCADPAFLKELGEIK